MEQIQKRKAIIVGVSKASNEEFSYEMRELHGLAEACNIEVIKEIIQYLDHPHTGTYVGIGKLAEISAEANTLNVDVVIFNDELSPAVLANISKNIDADVIDRTMLILEIFEKRAKTKEAKLQVELAKENFLLPRLVGARDNLSRLGGGGGGAGGARRGAGETALEKDRRNILNKINTIKKELADIVSSRSTTRGLRKKNDTPVVAFVGYTNAGKSSTINSILKFINNTDESKEVFVKNMLFATLETSSRGVKLPNNHEFIITDTVGFIKKLPHHLVESFKSTLEEITEASLIVHLVEMG